MINTSSLIRKLDALVLRLGWNGAGISLGLFSEHIHIWIVIGGPFQHQVTSIQVRSGQGRHGGLSFLGGHKVDKGKSTVTSIKLFRESDLAQMTKGTKQLEQFSAGGLKGNVPHHEFGGILAASLG